MAQELIDYLKSNEIWESMQGKHKVLIARIHQSWDKPIINAIDALPPNSPFSLGQIIIDVVGEDGDPFSPRVIPISFYPDPEPVPVAPVPMAEKADVQISDQTVPLNDSEQEEKLSLKERLQKARNNFNSIPWRRVGIIAAVILVLILGGIGLAFFRGGSLLGGQPQGTSPTESLESPNELATDIPDTSSGSEVPGISLWGNTNNGVLPQERSPMRKGFLDANGIATFIFVVALLIFVWLEFKERQGQHQGVRKFAIATIILALIMVPLVNWTATGSLGWSFLAYLTMVVLLIGPIASYFAHNDKTHASVLLIVWAVMLYVIGNFDLPVFFARLFGTTWTGWSGVYGIGGWISLISDFNFKAATLTTIIGVLCVTALCIAALEAGKRMGTGAYIVGVLMIITWIFLQFLTGKALQWAILQGASIDLQRALEIIRPIISWLLSVVVSLVLGFLFGDRELMVGERQVKLGIKSERAVATFVDFLIFSTIIALTGMIMTS